MYNNFHVALVEGHNHKRIYDLLMGVNEETEYFVNGETPRMPDQSSLFDASNALRYIDGIYDMNASTFWRGDRIDACLTSRAHATVYLQRRSAEVDAAISRIRALDGSYYLSRALAGVWMNHRAGVEKVLPAFDETSMECEIAASKIARNSVFTGFENFVIAGLQRLTNLPTGMERSQLAIAVAQKSPAFAEYRDESLLNWKLTGNDPAKIVCNSDSDTVLKYAAEIRKGTLLWLYGISSQIDAAYEFTEGGYPEKIAIPKEPDPSPNSGLPGSGQNKTKTVSYLSGPDIVSAELTSQMHGAPWKRIYLFSISEIDGNTPAAKLVGFGEGERDIVVEPIAERPDRIEDEIHLCSKLSGGSYSENLIELYGKPR